MTLTKYFFLAALFVVYTKCSASDITLINLNDSVRGEILVTMPLDVLKNASIWNPTNGEPPINISQAIKLSKNTVLTKFSNIDKVELEELSLTSCSMGPYPKIWFYKLTYVPLKNDMKSNKSLITVILLLDGKLTEPVLTNISLPASFPEYSK